MGRDMCGSEVSDQEFGLVGHQLFESLSDVEVEMSCAIEPNLSARRLSCVALRRRSRCDRIGCADTDLGRGCDALGGPAGPIPDQAQQAAGSSTVHPLIAVWQQRLHPWQRIGC